MSTTFHCCLDVQNFLETNRDKPLRYFETLFTDMETGRKLSGQEAVAELQKHINQGHKVIPLGECEGFSYQTGCPGHPSKIEAVLTE